MKAKLYWLGQHLKQEIHDLRFSAKCRWLSQHVEFLEWRWRVDGLLPSSRPAMVPVQRRGRHFVQPV
jgi:hypothetical protein